MPDHWYIIILVNYYLRTRVKYRNFLETINLQILREHETVYVCSVYKINCQHRPIEIRADIPNATRSRARRCISSAGRLHYRSTEFQRARERTQIRMKLADSILVIFVPKQLFVLVIYRRPVSPLPSFSASPSSAVCSRNILPYDRIYIYRYTLNLHISSLRKRLLVLHTISIAIHILLIRSFRENAVLITLSVLKSTR